jgi:hypothetical protein
MFQNRELTRIFGPKREKITRGGEDCTIKSFITCRLHIILLVRSN